MRHVFLLCLLFAFVSSYAQTDSELIHDSRARSNQAIAKHDTSGIASVWLDDVHVITSRSVELDGKLANQKAFNLDFQTKEKLLYIRTPSTVEIFGNWNMAAEYGKWVGTWTANGVSIKIGGSYYAKWHKVNGVWKIKAEMYTPLSCEGGDYCKSIDFQNSNAPIIVQNLYYPKPGKEKEVLETRQRASQVRAELGLAVGRILLRSSESTSQPYIIWECEYPSLQAREADVAALDKSDEFTKVQQHMGTLLEKFDRSLWQVVK